MIDLTGKVALVTGGSRGIGRACAERLAEAGADVVINYVSSVDNAQQTVAAVQRFGRRAIAVKADVSEQDDVSEMIDHVRKTFGRLDILVSNAASGGFRLVIGASARNFEAAMNTNVRALMFLVQSALPLLERSEGRAKVVAAIQSRLADGIADVWTDRSFEGGLGKPGPPSDPGSRRSGNQPQRRHGGSRRNRFDAAAFRTAKRSLRPVSKKR